MSMNIHFVEVNGSKADQPHCFCGTFYFPVVGSVVACFCFFFVCVLMSLVFAVGLALASCTCVQGNNSSKCQDHKDGSLPPEPCEKTHQCKADYQVSEELVVQGCDHIRYCRVRDEHG